jgi:hypothetical protein
MTYASRDSSRRRSPEESIDAWIARIAAAAAEPPGGDSRKELAGPPPSGDSRIAVAPPRPGVIEVHYLPAPPPTGAQKAAAFIWGLIAAGPVILAIVMAGIALSGH